MNKQSDNENAPLESSLDSHLSLKQWRVKRASDESILGPVDTDTLKKWANSGLVGAMDMIDLSDNDWRPATDMAFLEMIWLVNLAGEDFYGPTTLKNLRELIREGKIVEETLTMHVATGEAHPVGELLVALNIKEKSASYNFSSVGEGNSTKIVANKDARIMQLEEELRILRREHEMLNRLYRRLAMQKQEKNLKK